MKIESQKIVSKDDGNFNVLTGRLQPNEYQSAQDEVELEEHCEEKGSIHMKALPKEQTKSLRKNAESGVDSGEKISKLGKGEQLNNEAIINNQLPTAASGMKSDTTKGVSTRTTDKVRLEGSTTAMRIGGVESSPEMSIEVPLVANNRVTNNNLMENNGKLNESPNSMSTSSDNQVGSPISHQQLSLSTVSERQLNELGNDMISPTNDFNKIEDPSEDISVSKQSKMVQSTKNLINSDHTENVDLTGKGKSLSIDDVKLTFSQITAQAKVLENEAEQEVSMNGSIPKPINVSASSDDRQLLAARSMDNVNTIFISQSESLKEQTESERNNNELAAAGGRDDQVLTPRSIYNIRIEYAGPQSFHNLLGRSLKMRQRNVFADDDYLLASRSAPQGSESSLGKSLKKRNVADVGGTYNEVLAPRSVDNVRSEITAPQDNHSELSNDFKESVASVGSGDLVDNEVSAQRPDNDIRSEITAPQGTLCESLKNTEQTTLSGKTDDQYLTHRTDNAGIEIAASSDNQSSLIESATNFKELVVAGATGNLVSMDDVRDNISVSQGYQSPLGESLTKLKQTEIIESSGTGELLTTAAATVNVSQHKSMNESISKQPNDQHENQSTLSDPLLGALYVSSEIPAPHSNQTPLNGSFTNTTRTATTEEKDYHQSSSPTQQNNQIPLSDPVKNLKPDEVPKQVVAATSLDKVRGEEADQRPTAMTNNINTQNGNLLLARSMEMVQEKSQIKKLRQDKVNDVKSEYQTRQECDGSVMNAMKSICNKASTVSNEVRIKETNYLNLDGQTAAYHTETNRELSHVSSDDRKVQGGREIQVVNSTCCRQLLNDEELINRLSEKVFEKLFTEIHCCGPNCKSPCGGRNSYFKASERQ